MRPELFEPMAKVRARWLSRAEGGRVAPPTGPVYAATAVFLEPGRAEYSLNDQLSVVLRFAEGTGSTTGATDAEIDFLARELVGGRLKPGTKLHVMEGSQRVAEVEVETLLDTGRSE